jgi:hypothetical protein
MEETNMKPFSIILLVISTMSSLYSQQAADPEDLLSRATLGAVGEVSVINHSLPRGQLEADVRAIRLLSKGMLAPPMTAFKALSVRNQKIIVQAANESLVGEAYLEMVAAVLQCVAEGNITPEVGSIALSPSPGSSIEGVLAVNHADPRIAEVLPKLLSRYRDNPEESDYIRMLISGEAKKEHIENYESYGLKPAQVISRSPSNDAPPAPKANTISIPKKPLEVRAVPTASTEKTSSGMSWSILALLIIAVAGLLWWMLKRRS